MAQQWINNDSAREMTRKYNDTAEEVNKVARIVLSINEGHVVAQPSEFRIEDDDTEAVRDGA